MMFPASFGIRDEVRFSPRRRNVTVLVEAAAATFTGQRPVRVLPFVTSSRSPAGVACGATRSGEKPIPGVGAATEVQGERLGLPRP